MIPLKILPQPDDTTCGPTCLHAVYQYYGDKILLRQVIEEVSSLKEGGTFAVMLANHALKRGYKATIYTYNLNLFDPSWDFAQGEKLVNKLEQQRRFKHGRKITSASKAYEEYLEMGGRLAFEDLTPSLIKKYFDRNVPILTGLSATYLYKCPRETLDENGKAIYEDVQGTPMGHFVVLSGFEKGNRVVVADPFKENPVSLNHYYSVGVRRLIHSILLGILTYDANLLIIEKGD